MHPAQAAFVGLLGRHDPADELAIPPRRAAPIVVLVHLRQRLLGAQAGAVRQTEGFLDLLAVDGRHLGVASQADDVQPGHPVYVGEERKRRHVRARARVALAHNALADPRELVHHHVPGEEGLWPTDVGVPGDQGAVDEDDLVLDRRVVPGVRAGHPVGLVAHRRRLPGFGAAGDRHALAEHVVAADRGDS